MAFDPNAHNGRSNAAPPSSSVTIDFNAMLTRSMQAFEDIPGQPVASAQTASGYEGVYAGVPTAVQDSRVLGAGSQPPMPTELPPQAFLTSAMLLDFIDKKVNVVLRDDKTFVGILRSYDQYGNLVLSEAVERLFAKNPDHQKVEGQQPWLIADIYQGVVAIRGENVAVAGVVDLDQEDEIKLCTRVPEDRVRELVTKQNAEKKQKTIERNRVLRGAGLEPDIGMEG
jgi:U6 snRNA-associated Sm-like protein LSm1